MRLKIHRVGLVSGAVLLAIFSPLLMVYAGDDKKDEAPAASAQALESLQRLKWMHGEWATKQGDDTMEETWSAPTADSLMGMFRWIKADSVWMFELMTIVADGDDVVFRLKHFDRKMVGWEEKDESLTATLVQQKNAEAVFEGEGERFAFSLEDDGLIVRVGKKSAMTFRYRRKQLADTSLGNHRSADDGR